MTLENWQRDILEHGELFRVGGAVRDRIIDPSCQPAEVDYLARAIAPDVLESVLRRHGTLVLVGKRFGAYRFTPAGGGGTVDIVYPRVERSTGPGHRDFDVRWDWTLPVEADLRRRDFTVNAVAEDVRTGERVDPLGGARDIEARVLRAIFPEAFVEDPLRVLRGIRLAAQLEFTIEAGTRALMESGASGLATLSPERVQDELTKILTRTDAPSRAFALAHDLGALAVILPELDRAAGVEQNEYHPDDVFVHSLKSCDAAPRDDLAVRWAALLHDVGKVDARTTVVDERGERVVFYGHEKISAEMTEAVLLRLRYPRALVELCTRLVQHHMFDYRSEWKDATVRRFMRTVGDDAVEPLFRLREADCRSRDLDDEIAALDELRTRVAGERAARHTVRVEDLAVGGHDVMREKKIPPGERVGAILESLLERVIDDPSLNERETLLEMIRGEKGGGGE